MKITTIKIIAFLMILTAGTFDISAEVAYPTDQHTAIMKMNLSMMEMGI